MFVTLSKLVLNRTLVHPPLLLTVIDSLADCTVGSLAGEMQRVGERRNLGLGWESMAGDGRRQEGI